MVDEDEERVLTWLGSWRLLPDFARAPLVEAVAAWCRPPCDAGSEVPRFLDQLDGVLAATTYAMRASLAQQIIEEFPWFLPVERHADKLVRAALRRRRRQLFEPDDPDGARARLALRAWLLEEILPPALCEALADGDRDQRLRDGRGRRIKSRRVGVLVVDGKVMRPPVTPALLQPLEMPPKWLVPWLRRRTLEYAGYRILAREVSNRVDRPWSEVAREPNWHERDPEVQQRVRDVLESLAESDAEADLVVVAAEVRRLDPALLAELPPTLRRLCQAFQEGWARERILGEFGLRTEQYRQQKKRLFDTLSALRARS
jgi:hypothetical protein